MNLIGLVNIQVQLHVLLNKMTNQIKFSGDNILFVDDAICFNPLCCCGPCLNCIAEGGTNASFTLSASLDIPPGGFGSIPSWNLIFNGSGTIYYQSTTIPVQWLVSSVSEVIWERYLGGVLYDSGTTTFDYSFACNWSIVDNKWRHVLSCTIWDSYTLSYRNFVLIDSDFTAPECSGGHPIGILDLQTLKYTTGVYLNAGSTAIWS